MIYKLNTTNFAAISTLVIQRYWMNWMNISEIKNLITCTLSEASPAKNYLIFDFIMKS